MNFYILFLFYSSVKSLYIFSIFPPSLLTKFKNNKQIHITNKNSTNNAHIWETPYGYNILECIDIKKFDERSLPMVFSLF